MKCSPLPARSKRGLTLWRAWKSPRNRHAWRGSAPFCHGLLATALAVSVAIASSICLPHVVRCARGQDLERAEPVIDYLDHADLTYVRDANGATRPIRNSADWEQRRRHVVTNLQRVTGRFPTGKRVPLDVKVVDQVRVGEMLRKKITFQSDIDDRVPAWVMFPSPKFTGPRPAMLCLHQTTPCGKR